jgi:hypothetical protein
MSDSAKLTAKLTEAELAEIQRRRPCAVVSLACEGTYLTPEEEALVVLMDQERLTPDARSARMAAFIRAKQKERASVSV